MGFGSVGNLRLDTVMATPPSGQRLTGYFRTKFDLAASGVGRLELQFHRDDAAILYLDGAEIERSHEPGAILMSGAPDNYYLNVEGSSSAWVYTDIEGRRDFVRLEDTYLEAGDHVIAVSLHNAANSSGSFASSDFAFEMDSVKFFPQQTAEVSITVEPAPVTPIITSDYFMITGDTAFDSASIERNLYSNDSSLGGSGMPITPVLSLEIEGAGGGGQVLSTSPDSGDFTFAPDAGFRGMVSLSYTVTTAAGTSRPADILLMVVEHGEVIEGRQTVSAGTTQSFSLQVDPGILNGFTTHPQLGSASRSGNTVQIERALPQVGPDLLEVGMFPEMLVGVGPDAEWSVPLPTGWGRPRCDRPRFRRYLVSPGLR